ncbi:hypothetical protein COCNU_scaffold068551G000040 [Cocos nucifera]|nr:hypothetical protein [Cocos nucifera]
MPLAALKPPGWGLPRIPRPGGIGFPPPPPRNVRCADVRLPAAPPSGFAAACASVLRPYPERDGSLGYAAARARTRDGAHWLDRFLPTFVRAPSHLHAPSFDNAPASRPNLGCVSCSAVLRCRWPDDDSSFVRSRAARLHAWGMGIGRDAAATVSARERSWIRNQQRSPCLDAACLRWVDTGFARCSDDS